MRTDTVRMKFFEATASYLIPFDPVSEKCIYNTKRGVINASNTTGSIISTATGKVATGKTGVGFHFF